MIMSYKKEEYPIQSNSSITGAGSGNVEVVETTAPNLGVVKNASINGAVEQNILTSGIEGDSEVINNLLSRLDSLNKPIVAKRLNSLYNIVDTEDFDAELEEPLKLNSANDFVFFLENIDMNAEPHFGMNDDGQISSDWYLTDNGFLNLKFLGENKIRGLARVQEKKYIIEVNLSEVKNKLQELQII